MTEVWYAIPAANSHKAPLTIPMWKAQGYHVALFIDTVSREQAISWGADLVVDDVPYEGYPKAFNYLATKVPGDVVVTGGDDMFPDPDHDAQEIAAAFMDRFPDTYGVMQPAGDRWCDDHPTGLPLSERICGSPWIGRKFIEEANQGNGPFWEGYWHFYADEEMRETTLAAGVLWQPKQFAHFHDHWSRGKSRLGVTGRFRPKMPPKQWRRDQALFMQRQSENFPGHQRIGEKFRSLELKPL